MKALRHAPLIQLAWLPLVLVAITCVGGCAAYQFGSDAMFPVGIRTVHVPVVRNETFRHDLGVRLTDAIVDEITRRTPYVVTSDPNADSVLRCTVVGETKSVLTETRSDDPRALDVSISVRADWISRNGQPLMANAGTTGDSPTIGFSQSIRMVPEAGQSYATASQAAIEELAGRIVSQMEARW
ncbi:LPS assembly lipoprotein LptE [Stieleria varia]|uniref:Lipopolysaccharide-assembly n=1 Tax=Stieleria varia TaxID=2528005 RepID=A0A5C6B2A8_9BACT|nr:LPS assembly lipoprotein LptE [Stieleria varia]TWU06048.1 hypothetical protein Pla52n_17670 [Stieleria varia]